MATVIRRLVSSNYPYIPITIAIGPVSLTVEALLDTGFDGSVIAPVSLIDPAIERDATQAWTFVDGSTMEAPSYAGIVTAEQLGSFPTLIVAVGDEVLIGRRLLDNFRVILDFGRRVILER
jgi:predicted aspartyl protease